MNIPELMCLAADHCDYSDIAGGTETAKELRATADEMKKAEPAAWEVEYGDGWKHLVSRMDDAMCLVDNDPLHRTARPLYRHPAPVAPAEVSEDTPCKKAEIYGWIWVDDDYSHKTRHLIVGERPDDSPEWQAVYREPIPAAPAVPLTNDQAYEIGQANGVSSVVVEKIAGMLDYPIAPAVQEGLTRLVAEWREMHSYLCGPDDDPTDRMIGHAYGQCANDLENLLSTFPEPEKHNADSGEMRLTVSYLSSFLNEVNKSEDEDRDELLEYHLERALQWLDAAMKEAK